MKARKVIAILLSAVLLMSTSAQLLTVVADEATTDTYIVEARGYAVDTLQKNYGGERINDENLLTDVELTAGEARALENKFSVLSVEKDIVLTGDTSEETQETVSQWNLDAIGITKNENNTDLTRKVKVAIIDSGVSYTGDIFVNESIDLIEDEDKEDEGYENQNPLFNDMSGHGTAIAGVICAADDDVGITGINPDVLLYSARALDENNQAPLSRILQGIYWAIENEVDIINMSFGTNINSEILHNAIKDAYDAGILLVASSGNDSESGVKYPAAYDEVIAVGATDSTGAIWSDTSVGDELELLAPGEKIATSGFLGGVLTTSGTSIAAAEVSAVASLLWQKDTDKSANFIRSLLSASAKQVDNYGLIDYTYASEIYDDFATSYNEDDIELDFSNVSTPTDYSEITDCIVDGMWGNSSKNGSHATMVEDATNGSGLSSYYVEIIQYACTHVDAYYGKAENVKANCDTYDSSGKKVLTNKVNAFHGRGNFVANIRYVSNFAQYMGEGLSLDDALEKCRSKFTNLIKKSDDGEYVANDLDTGTYDSKHRSDGQVMAYMIKAIIEIYNDLAGTTNTRNGRLIEGNSTIGPRRRMLVYLGVVLHMIGDVYAHRTIVPTDSISSNLSDSKFAGGSFNVTDSTLAATNDLKNYVSVTSPFSWKENSYNTWKNFCKCVNLQIVEFQDIMLFEENRNTNDYDDNPDFYRARFNDANTLCKEYLTKILDRNFPDFTRVEKFYIKYLFPKSDGVKLNNLKNYMLNANLTSTVERDWNAHSTDEYV